MTMTVARSAHSRRSKSSKGRSGNAWRVIVLSLSIALCARPARAADPVIAPTGSLRAAYIVANLAQARLDPSTGAITGVVADIARELARRADVPVTITPLPTASAVLQAVRDNTADIGFVAPNPERTGVVLYAQTYMLVQQSALVRADSPLQSVGDLDRPGTVIGVNTDDSVGVWLQQRLAAATVRATSDYSLREAVAWLREGAVAAFAGGRQRLGAGTRDAPGLRMLTDNFYGVPQSIAVPLERADRLSLVNATLDALRASGFLADAVARSNVDGLTVAPGETPR
jgi:polar amino acid transport system substrate-binding protein